jgi:hypothetical protein
MEVAAPAKIGRLRRWGRPGKVGRRARSSPRFGLMVWSGWRRHRRRRAAEATSVSRCASCSDAVTAGANERAAREALPRSGEQVWGRSRGEERAQGGARRGRARATGGAARDWHRVACARKLVSLPLCRRRAPDEPRTDRRMHACGRPRHMAG